MLRGYPQISITPGLRSGKACITGTRITVVDILEWLAAGMSFAEIVDDYPELSTEGIIQALQYAADRERTTRVVAA